MVFTRSVGLLATMLLVLAAAPAAADAAYGDPDTTFSGDGVADGLAPGRAEGAVLQPHRVVIAINGDTLPEPDEDFVVNLSLLHNASFADRTGRGTILNDD